MFNPLEQFEVHVLRISESLYITNSILYMILISTFILNLFMLISKRSLFIPYRWQLFVEMFYAMVIDVIKQQIGLKAEKYFPFCFIIFSFILLSNFIGLVPYSFTVTSQLIITVTFSFSIFIGIIIIGFINHHLHFLKLFVPSGISKGLLPFLVVIEILSYLIRPFSLAIRLFANMLAGHTLLHIIAAFVFYMSKKNYIIFLLPFLFLLAITGLELAIAFIQAYVFLILICIYLNDSVNLHH